MTEKRVLVLPVAQEPFAHDGTEAEYVAIEDDNLRWLRERIMKVVRSRDVEPMVDFRECINAAFGLPENEKGMEQ